MTRIALLLDLDGTLVDTVPELAAAARAALAAHGVAADPAVDDAALRPHAGAGAHALLRRLSGREPEQDWIATLLEYYATHGVAASRPFAGWAPLLAARPWAVVTNKPRDLARRVMQAHWPEGHVLVAPEDAVAKPDPAGIELALARLGVAAADALYVGDDLRDAEAAAAAGVGFVLAAYGYGAADAERWTVAVDARIERPAELAAVLAAKGDPA